MVILQCFSAFKMNQIKNGNQKPWICDSPGCAYRTTLKGNLNKHKVRHGSTLEMRKPFPCVFNDCAYRAAQKAALQSHVKAKHSKERTRDFQCSLCPKKFYTKLVLEAHIPFHTNEKRFACTVCKFKSVNGSSLRRHVRLVHDDTVKFSCEFPGCEYSVKCKRSLDRHRLTHNEDPLLQRPIQ